MKQLILVVAACLLSGAVVSGDVPDSEFVVLDNLPGVNISITPKFQGKAKLSRVVRSLAKAGPFEVIFVDDVGDVLVELPPKTGSMKQQLVYLSRMCNLTYGIVRGNHLVVAPRPSQDERNSESGE